MMKARCVIFQLIPFTDHVLSDELNGTEEQYFTSYAANSPSSDFNKIFFVNQMILD